jgi:hypothetical protein
MPPVSNNPQRDTPLPVPEARDTGADFPETDVQDDGCLPALAGRFRITDLQHWIDLCA